MRIKADHKHSHDIYELARVIFPNKEITMVEQDYRIDSQLFEDKVKTSFIDKDIFNEVYLSDFQVFKDLGNWESKLLKYSFYNLFKDENQLAWGMLTGIRPEKLARQIGEIYGNPREILEKYFFLSSEKANLLTDIYKVQKPVIDKYKGWYSLYINIPFCPSVCSYCSYRVLPSNKYKNFIKPYVEKLIEEIKFILENYGKPSMAYIGGGTPSAIDPHLLEKIINTALSLGDFDEFTVEVGREDTINSNLLKMLDGKVDRICINPQSMNDSTAKLIGRKQSTKGILNAYEEARKYDFIINMDTIVGLPGEDEEDILQTFSKIVDLSPDNLTVHTLAMKKGSSLTKNSYENKEDIEKLLEVSHKIIKNNKYRPYYLYRQKDILGNFENTGYFKEEKVCAYNIVSMEESQSIIAAGMGAVSKILVDGNPIRIANFKSMPDYLDRFDEILERKKDIKL